MRKVKVGIIGCGVISDIYLENLISTFKVTEVKACADLFPDKAKESADKFNVPKACSVEELLADPEIEIVVNLTIPAAHTEINLAALNAGKHAYCEKPLALNMDDAKKTLQKAQDKNLLLGCAPDTFLGAGLQTCRKIIDDGMIGEPVGATANFVCHGHETWHPAPEFYYKEGAGPMMDMGPYYLTALVSLLGPINQLSCFARKTFEERTITSKAQKGKKVGVDVLTHYSGIIEFKNGAIVNINKSFDVWLSNLPCLEIYGTEGTLIASDPNTFGGPVKVLLGKDMVDSVDGMDVGEAVEKIHSDEMFEFFNEIPLIYQNKSENMRGAGVVDMAYALIEGRKHRTSGDLIYHVTEALTSFDKSAKEGTIYKMVSTCNRPEELSSGPEPEE